MNIISVAGLLYGSRGLPGQAVNFTARRKCWHFRFSLTFTVGLSHPALSGITQSSAWRDHNTEEKPSESRVRPFSYRTNSENMWCPWWLIFYNRKTTKKATESCRRQTGKKGGNHGSLQKQMWESKLPHKLWGMWKAVCRGLTNTTGLIRMLCVGFLGPPTSQTQPTLAVGNSNRNFVKDQLCESF